MPEEKKRTESTAQRIILARKKIGDLLVEDKLITQKQLEEATEILSAKGGALAQILVEKGYVTEEVVLTYLAKECGIEQASLADYPNITPEILDFVPASSARRQLVLPLKLEGRKLVVAMADPLNVFALDDIRLTTGHEVIPVIVASKEIVEAIDKYYAQEKPLEEMLETTEQAYEQALEKAESLQDMTEVSDVEESVKIDEKTLEAPVVKLVNTILTKAIQYKASDIHLEPYEKSFRVRFRIDGVLQEQPYPPKKLQNAIVARLKILAKADIAEKRVPQDGRIKLRLQNKEIDIRASFLPVVYGEKVVLRILDSSSLRLSLTKLGLEPEQLASYDKAIHTPHGIVLITGPTGSGKSTTLYSTLYILNQPDRNITTIEDPVEYLLPGINQIHVRNEVGLTFAEGLRSILRQDPNIVMIGEIRDKETAEIAAHAALTGHLVFATLHTNDAPNTITRLTHLGVEPFLIASSLILVIAQRLVRIVCPACKEAYEIKTQDLFRLGFAKEQLLSLPETLKLQKTRGCARCATTGYKGRIGIYEVMEVTDAIREAIVRKTDVREIKEIAKKQGMINLRVAALRKMVHGTTTMEELLRVTSSD